MAATNLNYTSLGTEDKTIGNFKLELDNLLVASKTLRPELYNQTIIDLVNKYDIPIKQKVSK